eukprot:TRINITY_DN781880_c0_g1_i1.p1 TRINITY_DN781880_c0_g1~~TRINITY_DN781880_c0_g1_i1.p1  ORF type:complete len:155 (+),score=17.02 TRINITY_DN781880_c0_g1_i1:86-550(+)
MSTNSRRRLMTRDLKRLRTENVVGIKALPSRDNVLEWKAVILGPEGTVWERGVFNLQLNFSEKYPIDPPTVIFKTKVFHPNVYVDGRICLDVLQKAWSSSYDILSILASIRSLLSDPNTDSPANTEAATLYDKDRRVYWERVKECVEGTWTISQ